MNKPGCSHKLPTHNNMETLKNSEQKKPGGKEHISQFSQNVLSQKLLPTMARYTPSHLCRPVLFRLLLQMLKDRTYDAI